MMIAIVSYVLYALSFLCLAVSNILFAIMVVWSFELPHVMIFAMGSIGAVLFVSVLGRDKDILDYCFLDRRKLDGKTLIAVLLFTPPGLLLMILSLVWMRPLDGIYDLFLLETNGEKV